jgi:hypothetical protein
VELGCDSWLQLIAIGLRWPWGAGIFSAQDYEACRILDWGLKIVSAQDYESCRTGG